MRASVCQKLQYLVTWIPGHRQRHFSLLAGNNVFPVKHIGHSDLHWGTKGRSDQHNNLFCILAVIQHIWLFNSGVKIILQAGYFPVEQWTCYSWQTVHQSLLSCDMPLCQVMCCWRLSIVNNGFCRTTLDKRFPVPYTETRNMIRASSTVHVGFVMVYNDSSCI